VFGSPADGMQRLLTDVRFAEPDVIVVAYGANEAFAGHLGLAEFQKQLEGLLDALEATGAPIALVGPPGHENLGPPLPDPTLYNRDAAQYAEAMRQVAAERGHHYIDLAAVFDSVRSSQGSPAALDRLTDDGVQLSPYGYWRTAAAVAETLSLRSGAWRVDIAADRGTYDARGTLLFDVEVQKGRVQFTARDDRLPFPTPPRFSPEGALDLAPLPTLRIAGLEPGSYELRIDDEPVAVADHREWAAGVRIASGPAFEQTEKLRRAIRAKNELYFHRYRPENETYLFLFRKHEQGNNAVEIPRFDPLIEEKEHQIEQLKVPLERHWVLSRRIGK